MKYITPFPANASHLFFIWSYFQSRLLQFGRKEGEERMKVEMEHLFLIKSMFSMYTYIKTQVITKLKHDLSPCMAEMTLSLTFLGLPGVSD